MTTLRHGEPEVPIIPAPRSGVTVLYKHAFLAILVGLALRLWLALRFPAAAGDSQAYLQLARNWADHHVYGVWLNGQLVPTDIRMPGYPVFLAGVAFLFGRSNTAIVLSQVALDLGTCLLTAGLAISVAPLAARRRVAIVGLWLSATCPFVANYSVMVLTESLTAFLTVAALICFAGCLGRETTDVSFGKHRVQIKLVVAASLGAFLAGLATLVRPEMPLLLASAGTVYALRWWKPLGWRKIILSGLAMAVAFALPLLPWATRNFITLHELQVLAPPHTTMPGEYAPTGYFAWTRTWLERFRDTYSTIWKISEEQMDIDDLPATAFDSQAERARVASLLDEYNRNPTLDISPEVDQEFNKIARERTRRDPLRTYVWVPFQRALSIWFTPRTELLPTEGKFWPITENWQDSRTGFLITAVFAALNYLYVALALGGIWVAWRAGRAHKVNLVAFATPNLWGIVLPVFYLLVRTVFLTTVEAPEPRYVVSCYPAVLALAALLGSRMESKAVY